MAECNHDCSNCSSNCGSREEPQSFLEPMNKASKVKKVIGVVSGKGGVGKSLVTSLLATEMAKRNFKTAVLDADITGPSIPKVFGIEGKVDEATEDGMLPAVTKKGTKLISINLLLDNADDPVVWRGPVIAGVVKQFWTDVVWGDVDYMFVDMPPGTGDVPLTVFQSLPISGIIVVTSPQDLVGMIVGKAVKMAGLMDIPVLGIIENMSYFVCPSCNEKHYIYGKSNIEEMAKEYGIKNVARLPIVPCFASLCDAGRIEDANTDGVKSICDALSKL